MVFFFSFLSVLFFSNSFFFKEEVTKSQPTLCLICFLAMYRRLNKALLTRLKLEKEWIFFLPLLFQSVRLCGNGEGVLSDRTKLGFGASAQDQELLVTVAKCVHRAEVRDIACLLFLVL